MKKIIAILIVIAILLLGTTSVIAGGGKVQKLNPEINQVDDSDHNIIEHCFQGVSKK